MINNPKGRPKTKEDAASIRAFLSTRLVINSNAYNIGLSVPEYLKTVFPSDANKLAVGEVKTCFACQKVKPVKEFYKSKQSKDGYQPSCKECQLGIVKVKK